jgi:hypothetical protein
MRIRFIKAFGLLDQRSRPNTFYQGDEKEVDDRISQDLIKHNITVFLHNEPPESFAVTPEIKRG